LTLPEFPHGSEVRKVHYSKFQPRLRHDLHDAGRSALGLLLEREIKVTSAPARASSRAASYPIPLFAPVTRIRLPVCGGIFLLVHAVIMHSSIPTPAFSMHVVVSQRNQVPLGNKRSQRPQVAKRTTSKKLLDAAAICEALHPEKEAVIRDVLSRVTDKWSLWALSELTSDGPLPPPSFSRMR
jgi:hypothetical protein